MATFQLDTSGIVNRPSPNGFIYPTEWSDLTPFQQGYVEALFANLRHVPSGEYDDADVAQLAGFSDLAPETLARIIADCEAWRKSWSPVRRSDNRRAGELFWTTRQEGSWAAFPPLTVTLGDDGRVYLKERS